MPRFCASCGAPMAEGAISCSSCGTSTAQNVGGGAAAVPAAAPSTGGLTDNVAGLLAYITIIPSIIFLVMEPYNRNRFVRFHSFQNIFFCVACIAGHCDEHYRNDPHGGVDHAGDLAADWAWPAGGVGHSPAQGVSRSDVQAACDRRHGGKAGQRIACSSSRNRGGARVPRLIFGNRASRRLRRASHHLLLRDLALTEAPPDVICIYFCFSP